MGASGIALKPKANNVSSLFKVLKILKTRDFPGGPVAKTPVSQCRGPGFSPAEGARPHMLPLRTRMLQLRLAQPNKLIKKKSFGDFLFSMG